jgi:hypothetical protein
MTRSFIYGSALAFCGVLSCSACFAQSPAPSATQSSSAAPATSPAQPQDAPAATADAKKPKKVWTNEDVNGLSGPVSVVGNSKNSGKASSGAKADGQYIATTRKELAKLQSQLDDTDKQLSDLKDFSEGKAPATSSGYQIIKATTACRWTSKSPACRTRKSSCRTRSVSCSMKPGKRASSPAIFDRHTLIRSEGVFGWKRYSVILRRLASIQANKSFAR